MSLNFYYADIPTWTTGSSATEARKVLGLGVEQRQLTKRRVCNSEGRDYL